MKIAIVAPDGTGIRNFVLGPFLKRFPGEALILHACAGPVLQRLESSTQPKAEWQPLAPVHERPLPFTLRQMLSYAHVYWADTHSMRYTRSRTVGGSWRTIAANRTARAVGRLAAFPKGIQTIESAYFASVSALPEIRYYRDILRKRRPDVLFSTSQQAPRVLMPVLAARSLGIPTVTFVASWDNLTSKGRIAAPFDHYLVWSDHMRRELLRYYPRVSPERVHVVGTPQFDCYADPDLRWSRREFFERVGADESRPLICYSGGDEGTCPDDQHHVRILMEHVRSGLIQGAPQVLLRPCPVDPGTRYNQVSRDYPELIVEQPKWQHPESGPWSLCVPYPEDIQFISNLMRYSDMNVNVASTMTLDFALHDKPVVNVAFDVTQPPPAKVPLWNLFYSWEHYQPVVEFGAARFAKSPVEIAEKVNRCLRNPREDHAGRKKLVDLQVGVPPGQSGPRITKILQSLVN